MAAPINLILWTAVRTLLVTLVWLPFYIYRCCVIAFVEKFKPSFGKIFDHLDTIQEENYCDNTPCNSLAYTLVLNGPLELSELRKLFDRNVLQAKFSDKKGKDKVRYLELRQYTTSFAGFTIWRDDPSFNIADHIKEQSFREEKFSSMAKLHQRLLNEKFPSKKSPWEMILVRNHLNEQDKTLLVFRCHHSLADTKSCIKLLIESLGEKSVKMPQVNYVKRSLLDRVKHLILFPFYFVYVQVLAQLAAVECDRCHWIQGWRGRTENKQNVGISKKIALSDVKAIAKENGVTTSAVIMAANAGGVGKSHVKFARQGMPVEWVLPKMDHPDKLANHLYLTLMDLPTNVISPLERLRECNEIFLKLKSSTLHEYGECVLYQDATWCGPLRGKFSIPVHFPLIISNIASDGEGFSVGSVLCTEFTMTSGAIRAIICTFSYKDVMEVTVTFQDSMLKESETHQLTKLIENEFDILKDMS